MKENKQNFIVHYTETICRYFTLNYRDTNTSQEMCANSVFSKLRYHVVIFAVCVIRSEHLLYLAFSSELFWDEFDNFVIFTLKCHF